MNAFVQLSQTCRLSASAFQLKCFAVAKLINASRQRVGGCPTFLLPAGSQSRAAVLQRPSSRLTVCPASHHFRRFCPSTQFVIFALIATFQQSLSPSQPIEPRSLHILRYPRSCCCWCLRPSATMDIQNCSTVGVAYLPALFPRSSSPASCGRDPRRVSAPLTLYLSAFVFVRLLVGSSLQRSLSKYWLNKAPWVLSPTQKDEGHQSRDSACSIIPSCTD